MVPDQIAHRGTTVAADAGLKNFMRLEFPKTLLMLALAACGLHASGAEPPSDTRGRQFIGFTSLTTFQPNGGAADGKAQLTSPPLRSRISFDEVVVSWDAQMPEDSSLVVEARAIYHGRKTKYYTMGLWSPDPARHPRRSQPDQKDENGNVATDVLSLTEPADSLDVRITMGWGKAGRPRVTFLGVSLADTHVLLAPLPPERAAWGKVLPVPERTQMIYPNGKALCSPTTVSMLLAYWANRLERPELDHTVPEIAAAIYDSQWKGTGNWPFNMAYAGSFPGLRAYVSRLSDVSELEQWIAQGIPVGLSVDYDRLRAKGPGPNGHLVVCVGFTETGDPIINDPGTSRHVRKVFARQRLVEAWACSRNTAYLIYPDNLAVPQDRFGHWD